MKLSSNMILVIQLSATAELKLKFLWRCHYYSTQRSELFDYLAKDKPISLNLDAKDKLIVLIYGSKKHITILKFSIKMSSPLLITT